MDYRVLVILTNDDLVPSPESVLHLVRHRLQEDGYVTGLVTMEDSHDDAVRDHLDDALSGQHGASG